MQADIQGALNQINKTWRAFEHKGKPMTKTQVIKVLKYALTRGYKTTAELSDEEVDCVLSFNETPELDFSKMKIYGQDNVRTVEDPSKF